MWTLTQQDRCICCGKFVHNTSFKRFCQLLADHIEWVGARFHEMCITQDHHPVELYNII